MMPFVKGDTAWCSDAPECPSSFSSMCQCESTQTGRDCYVYSCRDTNNDGCLELDWNEPTKCPGNCEQVSQYVGQCEYNQPQCDYICDLGDRECIGGYPEPFGGSSTYKVCRDLDGDGCGEWDYYDCPPNQQCENGRCYSPYPPPPQCTDSCNLLDKRCMTIGNQEYRELCEDWDGDTCMEWWSEVNPEQTGTGMEWCEFGCDEEYLGKAVCYIEPDTPQSECESGDSQCLNGVDLVNCGLCGDTGYYSYMCNGTANVTKCPYGCTKVSETQGKCDREKTVRPIWNRTYFDGLDVSQYPGGIAIRGIAYIDEHYLVADNNAQLNGWEINSYDEDWAWVDGINITECDSLSDAIMHITSDEEYLWILSGNSPYWIVGKYDSSGVCLDTVINTTIPLNDPIAVTDDYIFAYSYEVISGSAREGDLIYKFGKSSGEVLDVYTIDIDVSVYQDLQSMYGYGDYLWINEDHTAFSVLKKYTDEWTYTNVYLNSSIDFGYALGEIVRTSDKLYVQYGYNIHEFDYTGTGYARDQCIVGDAKCSDLMYVDTNGDGDSEWIRPYLLYCDDYDNDGLTEWSKAFNYSHVTGSGESCVFGCYFNTTTYQATCRDSQQANCTDVDWVCQPDSTRCFGEFMQTCEDRYNTNCYNWVNDYPCRYGCDDDKMCKQCQDVCVSGESKCFLDGFGGIDIQNQESVFYPGSVVVNCTYDNNGKCWTWDITQLERCPLGCRDNETSDLTMGYCYSETELEDDYLFANLTQSVRTGSGLIFNYFDWVFPTESSRWLVSIGVGIIISALILFKAGFDGWKLSIFSFIMWTLVCSLFGWLPVWWTIIVLFVSVVIIAKKFWMGVDE